MQLRDMNMNGADVLDLALEKIEKLSKNQYFRDTFFRDDLSEKFDLSKKEDTTKAQIYFSKRVMSHIPNLMRFAKEELSDYFSFVNGISKEEYQNELTVGKLYKDVYGMMSDETFLNFFYSFAETVETP